MTVYIGVDFHPYEQTVKAIEKAIGVKSDRGHKAIGVKKAIGIRPSILRFSASLALVLFADLITGSS